MLSSSAYQRAPKGGIKFDNLDGKECYKPWQFYGQSKMANLLFAKELARRFQPGGRAAYAVHPGVIITNLSRNMGSTVRAIFNTLGPLFTKTIPQGAATEVFCAANPKPRSSAASIPSWRKGRRSFRRTARPRARFSWKWAVSIFLSSFGSGSVRIAGTGRKGNGGFGRWKERNGHSRRMASHRVPS
jgi:NAD(P)-dependent dehydrogenase (short-subunit alcohol dehydrogenase family)